MPPPLTLVALLGARSFTFIAVFGFADLGMAFPSLSSAPARADTAALRGLRVRALRREILHLRRRGLRRFRHYFWLRLHGPTAPPLTSFAASLFGARSFTFSVVGFAGFAITCDSDCRDQ